MKQHYAIQHTDFSRNDSDEKIRDWKTARVYRFSTRAERDAFCADSDNNDVINAKRANYIGYVDADNTILAEDTIRAARIAAGLTQKQLGEAAGLESITAQPFVASWEAGTRPIPRDKIKLVAAALHIDPTELI